MEVKFYWLFEQLGLVTPLIPEYANGYATYRVSAMAGEVWLYMLLSLLPVLFFSALLLRRAAFGKGWQDRARRWVRNASLCLLLYAALLAVGVGPYVSFYPHGGSFIDLSALEHLCSGVVCALLSLLVFLGGRCGHALGRRRAK